MKSIKLITAVIILSIAAACSDSFLEVKPKAALERPALSNAKGANALLIAAYSMLDGWATAEGAYRSYMVGADNWVYGSVASDDAYKGTIAGDQPPISCTSVASGEVCMTVSPVVTTYSSFCLTSPI